ncbi:MAG: MFS transporter [Chloroflexi bacterium]|nr:MFS transporter [Chloroflexota bacterium]
MTQTTSRGINRADVPGEIPALSPSHFSRNWRWNFIWVALSGALFQFGAAFADTGTVVAVFVGRLTPSAFAVGAAESIARYGWLLPQLFVANYAQGLRYRKPIYLVGGWGRASFLALLAGVLLIAPIAGGKDGALGRDAAFPLLVVFFVLWTAFSFISGLAGVPYNDIVGRVIPSNRRSRLLAVRFSVGGVLAVGAGFFVRVTLQGNNSLAPYGIIFGVGAVMLALSTGCFALVREPPSPVVRERSGFSAFLRQGWRVLRGDTRFLLFLYAQLLAGLTAMAIPFYVVQARRVSGLAEAEVGTLLAAQTLGGLLLNPLWGWWGDRRGKLSLLKALAVTGLVSPLLGLMVPGMAGPRWALAGYMATFFFLGAVAGGQIIGGLSYLMEISPDDRRPEYSGYMNALVAPTRLLPLLAAGLADAVGFGPVFAAAVVAGVLRLGMLQMLEATSE